MHTCTLHTCKGGDQEEWSWRNITHKAIFVLNLEGCVN